MMNNQYSKPDSNVQRALIDLLKPLLEVQKPNELELNYSLERLRRFTRREMDVLLLICRGYTLKQIADELVISANTARDHIRRVTWKLGLSSMREVQAAILFLVAALKIY